MTLYLTVHLWKPTWNHTFPSRSNTLFFDLLRIPEFSGQAILSTELGLLYILLTVSQGTETMRLDFGIAERESKLKLTPTCKFTVDVASTQDCESESMLGRWCTGSIERIS